MKQFGGSLFAVAVILQLSMECDAFAMGLTRNNLMAPAAAYQNRQPGQAKVALNLEKMPHITFLLGLAREILNLAGQSPAATTSNTAPPIPAATTYMSEQQTAVFQHRPTGYQQAPPAGGFATGAPPGGYNAPGSAKGEPGPQQTPVVAMPVATAPPQPVGPAQGPPPSRHPDATAAEPAPVNRFMF